MIRVTVYASLRRRVRRTLYGLYFTHFLAEVIEKYKKGEGTLCDAYFNRHTSHQTSQSSCMFLHKNKLKELHFETSELQFHNKL